MSEELRLIHQVTTMSDMEGNLIVGRDRESYFLTVPGKGAVEAWRTKSLEGQAWTDTGYYGGIEIHHKNNPGEKWWGGHMKSCWVTGGECWTDGSSLAFESVEHFFDRPSYVQSVLMDWARDHFDLNEGEKAMTQDVRDLIAEADRAAEDVFNVARRERDLIRRLADALEAATRERDAALAAIERVRAQHQVDEYTAGHTIVRCVCEEMWPCSTIKALDGAPEPEDEEEEYQAGCGSWDCRAPECGRANE